MTYLKSNDLFEKISPEKIFEQVPRPILIADHLMTPDNLGAMIRLADNRRRTQVRQDTSRRCIQPRQYPLVFQGSYRFTFHCSENQENRCH